MAMADTTFVVDTSYAGDTSHAESQSSQIVNFVLGKPSLQRALSPNQENTPVPAPNNNPPNDTSADDTSGPANESVSDASDSSVQYHFHGLANTQTQSQYSDEPQHADSQKENAPTVNHQLAGALSVVGNGGNQAGNKTAANNHALEFRKSNSPPTPLENLATIALSIREQPPLAAVKATKAVAFLSPARQPSSSPEKEPLSPSMRLRRRRSTSPASQDSFAGPPVVQDPELYVAMAPQFDRPLKELGHSSSIGRSTPYSASAFSHSSNAAALGKDASRVGSLKGRESLGKVLVENSDESSVQSQSDSQDSQESIPQHQPEEYPEYEPLTFSQQSTEIVGASSKNSAREVNSRHTTDSQESTEDLVATQILQPEATQILEQTQPASQEYEATQIMEDEPSQLDIDLSNILNSMAEPASTGASTGSRPLWTATIPEKQARYALLHKNRIGVAGPSQNTATTGTPVTQLRIPPIAGQEHSSSVSPSKNMKNTPTDAVPDSEARSEASHLVLSHSTMIQREQLHTEEVVPASETDRDGFSSDVVMRDLNEGVEKEKAVERRADSPLKTLANKAAERASTPKQVTKSKETEVPIPAVSPLNAGVFYQPKQAKHQYGKGKKSIRKSAPAPAPKAAQQNVQATSSVRSTRQKPKRVYTEPDTDDDEQSDVPTLLVDDEQETVMEEDEESESEASEVDDNSSKVVQGSKRKRTSTTKAKKPSAKPSKTVKRASTIASRPPPKKICLEATRVFAYWKATNSYFAGTVHSLAEDNEGHYVIQFDDGDSATLDASRLRLCTLRVGDHVCPKSGKRKAKVIDVEKWERYRIATIKFDGLRGDEVEVTSAEIHIPANTFQYEWTDRAINPEEVVTIVGRNAAKAMSSPLSNVSSTSRSKPLSNTGFVITLKPGTDHWEERKKDLFKAIKDLGGAVLGDWKEVFNLKGQQLSNKQWAIEKADVTLRAGVERVFLLADEPNQKSKYLIALGLGIPCVSVEWPKTLARQEDAAWQSFLLPAGQSEHLGTRVTQTIDYDWGKSPNDLDEIMDSHVPHKLLWDKNVLCLGAEMMPSENSEDASRMIPHIVLGMGAARVEVVADKGHASATLSDYDYVVVRNANPVKRKNVTCVDVNWIKNCLISGKLLPLPKF